MFTSLNNIQIRLKTLTKMFILVKNYFFCLCENRAYNVCEILQDLGFALTMVVLIKSLGQIQYIDCYKQKYQYGRLRVRRVVVNFSCNWNQDVVDQHEHELWNYVSDVIDVIACLTASGFSKCLSAALIYS